MQAQRAVCAGFLSNDGSIVEVQQDASGPIAAAVDCNADTCEHNVLKQVLLLDKQVDLIGTQAVFSMHCVIKYASAFVALYLNTSILINPHVPEFLKILQQYLKVFLEHLFLVY